MKRNFGCSLQLAILMAQYSCTLSHQWTQEPVVGRPQHGIGHSYLAQQGCKPHTTGWDTPSEFHLLRTGHQLVVANPPVWFWQQAKAAPSGCKCLRTTIALRVNEMTITDCVFKWLETARPPPRRDLFANAKSQVTPDKENKLHVKNCDECQTKTQPKFLWKEWQVHWSSFLLPK